MKYDLIISGWLTEIKVAYSAELQELTQKNAELMTDNELLLQQVTALRKVKEQLKALGEDDEEINVDGVFITTQQLDVMKNELKETGNLI